MRAAGAFRVPEPTRITAVSGTLLLRDGKVFDPTLFSSDSEFEHDAILDLSIAVPEPRTFLLIGLGLLGFAVSNGRSPRPL